MKKRNRANRRRTLSRPFGKGIFADSAARKRKSYTFEQLEERLAFTATPLDTSSSLSNDTLEGAAAILLRELQWAALQSANAPAPEIVPLALPSDPYFPNPLDLTTMGMGQWHLFNVGQEVGNPDFQNIFGEPGEDINVIDVWQGLGFDQPYTGKGVLIAVLDTGVDTRHPDLKGNLHPTFRFNALDGSKNVFPDLRDDFGQIIPEAYHGTAVAGLIAATWNLDGNPTIGGVGVAPEATLVPILLVDGEPSIYDNGENPIGSRVAALRYALMVGVDITTNAWGPADTRTISAITELELDTLRDMVIFGRDGLGMINIFAAGNGGGDGGSLGFPQPGTFDSTAYNPFLNSRYVITVTGVDADGLYMNSDGSGGTYAEAGANVLVAAPTGNNLALDIADDDGQGSGLWTTDLLGDLGANAATDPDTLIDDDRDFLEDPNYTSRFNGSSAAAAMVSGVVALMLEANPNLTYRDVQEILVRSARQNAQFEIPENSSGDSATYSTWQTNQMGPFRDPDAFLPGINVVDALEDPLADPTLDDFPRSTIPEFYIPGIGNDAGRLNGHYELQPAEFANGAGYTVSQGYGIDNEMYGYGHGVVDAELAVRMAEVWHTLNQDIAPGTEKTFTTGVSGGTRLNAGEKGSQDTGFFVIPGGIGGLAGFNAFWNEYYADPPAPFDPANAASWPRNTRGASYLDYVVPVDKQMNVEWVEVRIAMNGAGADVENLKINLTSPNGMQSELNHYYMDTSFGAPFSTQLLASPVVGTGGFLQLEPGSDLTDQDTFIWTFATNRSWGESTNGAVIENPLTGEPQAGPGIIDFSTGSYIANKPIVRDWELHLENWSTTLFANIAIEIVFHGKPIGGGSLDPEWLDEGFEIPVAQRIQGIVGIDVNEDDEFSGIDPNRDNEWNSRYIQEFVGFDETAPRSLDLDRRLLDDFDDLNGNGRFDDGDVRRQEPYAANVLVEAYRYTPGASNDPADDIVEAMPVAQFLTGADGNYYFDLVPGNYIIRATDLNDLPGSTRDDPNTPIGFRRHYEEQWRINADWFYAPDRDVTIDTDGDGDGDIPGEIFQPDRNAAPTAFRFANSTGAVEPRIPMAIKDLNFLLKPNDTIPTLPNTVVVNGTVYADVDGNSAPDIFDGAAGGMRVYVDSIRNGVYDQGEQFVNTNESGAYSLTIATTDATSIVIGVDVLPGWVPSATDGDQKIFFGGPGAVFNGQDFFLTPPSNPTGVGPGNIAGFVFDDADANGMRDYNEGGLAGVTVFIDAGVPNGILDAGERSTVTGANGAYFFANVTAGTYRLDVVNSANFAQTPAFQTVALAAGETRIGVGFGLFNLAYRDFGDLPASFNASGTPTHVAIPGFQLGATVTGEIPGAVSSGSDNASDDGVTVLSNGGIIKAGENRILVKVSGYGGRLTGWIDWNGNGSFQTGEQIEFRDAAGNVLGKDADLAPNPLGQELRFTLPSVPDTEVAARFRWGEVGLGLDGQSFIGEVEDYIWDSSLLVQPSLQGDFNQDDAVDAADYVLWRKFMGTGLPLPNSSNSSSPAAPQDKALWVTNFGMTAAGSGGSAAASAPPAALVVDSGSQSAALAETPTTSDDDASESAPSTAASLSFAPIFVAPSTDGNSMTSFGSIGAQAQADSVASDELSEADALLLLDQAIAELDDSDDDAPLADRKGEEDGYDDPALAAVFEDNTSWWSL